MLLWSNQWKIINNTSLSFQKNKKVFTKMSTPIMERDKVFLNPNKYSSYSENDFKFLVLWTCLNTTNTKIDTLKQLQNYTKENNIGITAQKNKIIYHMNTIKEDVYKMNIYDLTPAIVQKLYYQGEISIIGAWLYFKDVETSGRIQKKFKDRIDYFMSNFSKVAVNVEESGINFKPKQKEKS